jgi:hypothetical protein
MLRKKELVMGFGHRVYRKGDPRSDIIKECSRVLTTLPGGKPELWKISEHIEKVVACSPLLHTIHLIHHHFPMSYLLSFIIIMTSWHWERV